MNDLSTSPHGNHTKAIIDYASLNYGVENKVEYFKKLEGGSYEVSLRDSTEVSFTGTGVSKAEACADAVSSKYPS